MLKTHGQMVPQSPSTIESRDTMPLVMQLTISTLVAKWTKTETEKFDD